MVWEEEGTVSRLTCPHYRRLENSETENVMTSYTVSSMPECHLFAFICMFQTVHFLAKLLLSRKIAI